MADEATPPTGDRDVGEFEFGDDAAPDDEEEKRTHAEDFFVTRDEEGNINTVTEEAGDYGEVEVQPMTYGHVERYFGDAGNVANADPETVAEILRNHVVEPNFEAHAAATYGKDEGALHAFNGRVIAEEMEPFAPVMMLLAVFRASGLSPDIDMDSGGNATIDFEGDEGNLNAR